MQAAWSKGLADVDLLDRYFCRASKRRSVPAWALPLEIWSMLLRTPKDNAEAEPRLGVGSDPTVTEGVFFKKWLHMGMMMIRYWGVTPAMWNISQCFAIPKAAVPGPKGKRIVHGLDPVGKGFLKVL